MNVSEKIAEKEAILEKEKLTREERLAQENESLSRIVQETIQGSEEALCEKDTEIQRLQVYCV